MGPLERVETEKRGGQGLVQALKKKEWTVDEDIERKRAGEAVQLGKSLFSIPSALV